MCMACAYTQVLFNGGALAIDDLVSRPPPAHGSSAAAAAYAIVEGFSPNTAGVPPLAAALFGDHNRWGKLPVTGRLSSVHPVHARPCLLSCAWHVRGIMCAASCARRVRESR